MWHCGGANHLETGVRWGRPTTAFKWESESSVQGAGGEMAQTTFADDPC